MRSTRSMGGLVAGAVGAVVTRAAYETLTRLPPQLRVPWDRTNHAGNPVTLLEGPAVVLGGVAAAALARAGAGPVVAVLGSGLFGALDDLTGDTSIKGFSGHLRAASRGRVTTGLVKILGIGASGVLAAALIDRRRGPLGEGDSPHVGALSTVAAAATIAGSANLANLLDLRPGRALKVAVVAGAATALTRGGAGARVGLATSGVALGALPPDLRGRAMLGDTGANALGALAGTALAARLGTGGRLTAASLLLALTLVSEKVSFTRVIESTPGLREFDRWGRS